MSAELDDDSAAQIRYLQGVLLAEEARRAAIESSAMQSPSPDGLDSDASSPSTGTVRTRSDMENDISGSFHGFVSGPYTLEEGRALKRSKNLSAKSDADAEVFLKTLHPMQHAYQGYLLNLECRDKLESIWADHNAMYKPTPTFTRTLLDWAHAAVLSADAKSYRDPDNVGPSIAANVITVMRGANISELPPTKETGRCDVARSIVQKGLTEWRHHVKACVFGSLLDDDPDKENDIAGKDIATLTRACIGTAPTVPTAKLYQRIAFIRFCARNSKVKKTTTRGDDAKFWVTVDGKLALWRKTAGSKEQLQILMNNNYEEDKKIYGAPDSAIPVTELKDMEDWLKKLNESV